MRVRLGLPLALVLFSGCSDINLGLDAEDLFKFEAQFDLTVAPAELTVTAGATSAPLTVTMVPRAGFSATVDVEILGLPPGAVPTPASPFRLRPNQSREVVIATSGVASGEHWVRFQAKPSRGGFSEFKIIRLIVSEPPGSSRVSR